METSTQTPRKENVKPTIQEKRAYLKELSSQATELREKLLHEAKNDAEIQAINDLSINDIIVNHFYKDSANTEFHTFKGWLKEGKAVRKGETAFLVWGRPKAVQEQEAGKQTTGEEEEDTFFPVSFIFSNAQVIDRKND